MNILNNNAGFITGFGAGIVACYVIGKVVYRLPTPKRETDDSDSESGENHT